MSSGARLMGFAFVVACSGGSAKTADTDGGSETVVDVDPISFTVDADVAFTYDHPLGPSSDEGWQVVGDTAPADVDVSLAPDGVAIRFTGTLAAGEHAFTVDYESYRDGPADTLRTSTTITAE